MKALLTRMGGDFQLAMLVLFAACAVIGITPFVFVRYLQGEIDHALVNALVVILLCLPSIHAWHTGRVTQAANTMALMITGCCLLVSLLYGRQALFWSYVVVATNFMMIDRRWASALGVVLVASLLPQTQIFLDRIEMLAYGVTTFLIMLYSYIAAVRQQRQREGLRSMATRDPLTGAGNRRLMEEDLARLTDAYERDPAPATLAMIDIDHFKQVNDRHGHEAGDRVLMELAARVTATLRRTDRFYRFGGEEFVLALPGADAREGERLLRALHRELCELLRCNGAPVNVSIGASALLPGEDWSTWLGRADAALYRAKRGGRARLVFDHQPEALLRRGPMADAWTRPDRDHQQ